MKYRFQKCKCDAVSESEQVASSKTPSLNSADLKSKRQATLIGGDLTMKEKRELWRIAGELGRRKAFRKMLFLQSLKLSKKARFIAFIKQFIEFFNLRAESLPEGRFRDDGGLKESTSNKEH